MKLSGRNFNKLVRKVQLSLYAKSLGLPRHLRVDEHYNKERLVSIEKVLKIALERVRDNKNLPCGAEWSGASDFSKLLKQLENYVNAGLKCSDAKMKKSAEQLKRVLNKFENLQVIGLPGNTRLIKSLVRELSKDYNAEKLRQLAGFDWLKKLDSVVCSVIGGLNDRRTAERLWRLARRMLDILAVLWFVARGCNEIDGIEINMAGWAWNADNATLCAMIWDGLKAMNTYAHGHIDSGRD